MVEEITVTARKIEENLQDIPMSVQALSGDLLDELGATRLYELQFNVPGLVVNLSQTELAKLLHPSQSRVAKMEGGDPSVSIDLLIRSLLALGASNRDLARAISGAEVATAR